jgi:hypothetical protein
MSALLLVLSSSSSSLFSLLALLSSSSSSLSFIFVHMRFMISMLSDWVSFLAYPNLFEIKGFVVVDIVVVHGLMCLQWILTLFKLVNNIWSFLPAHVLSLSLSLSEKMAEAAINGGSSF